MASQGTAVVDTIEDYSKMKVVELKKLLKDRGLSVAGTKDELIERLKQANEAAEKKLLEETAEETTGGDTTAASIDEELENEIMNDENKVTSTSLAKPGEKRKLTENGSSESSEPPAKKLEVEENKENSGEAGAVSADTEDKDNATDSPSKKIIKLSTITPEEKRELRAKKFGLTEEEKKEARAKRFGISAAAEAKTNSNKVVKSPLVKAPAAKANKNTELLKKRAERFGLLGGNQKLTPEEEEKRKKRAERFGTNTPQPAAAVVVTAATTPASTPPVPVATAITVEK